MTMIASHFGFINSDRRCPRDSKLMAVEVRDGDTVHVCLHCDHSELDIGLPVSVAGVVAAVRAQRDVVWPTVRCSRCARPVIAVRSREGKPFTVDAEPGDGGVFRLFARPNVPPFASWTPVPKRRPAVLYTAHVTTCGAR